MSIFEDFSKFLESRLEEFIKNNPHLELQALEDQLNQQQEDTLRLIADLQRQEKKTQDEILNTAQEIQLWSGRIDKAKKAGREDLVKAAQEREAALLRQGNQLWGQMQGVKQRIDQSKALYKQINQKKAEIKTQVAQAQASAYTTKPNDKSWETGWNQSSNYTKVGGYDPLEKEFEKWEADEELARMKREMNK